MSLLNTALNIVEIKKEHLLKVRKDQTVILLSSLYTIEQALKDSINLKLKYDELVKDVARYFELLGKYAGEFEEFNELANLKEKLSKVGKEE